MQVAERGPVAIAVEELLTRVRILEVQLISVLFYLCEQRISVAHDCLDRIAAGELPQTVECHRQLELLLVTDKGMDKLPEPQKVETDRNHKAEDEGRFDRVVPEERLYGAARRRHPSAHPRDGGTAQGEEQSKSIRPNVLPAVLVATGLVFERIDLAIFVIIVSDVEIFRLDLESVHLSVAISNLFQNASDKVFTIRAEVSMQAIQLPKQCPILVARLLRVHEMGQHQLRPGILQSSQFLAQSKAA
mmetsp:Transcript_45332/g.114070  ORF Transcript_45332/g.114070 Transcript_45332/m.114070 type:complete len:246 (-) Transcript_45332:754-1491(-)